MSRSVWKNVFIARPIFQKTLRIVRNGKLHNAHKYILTRAGIISKKFARFYVHIYNGMKFKRRRLNHWMIGFHFGDFTWNRKKALYKAKQIRKKKKKEQKALRAKAAQLQMKKR